MSIIICYNLQLTQHNLICANSFTWDYTVDVILLLMKRYRK